MFSIKYVRQVNAFGNLKYLSCFFSHKFLAQQIQYQSAEKKEKQNLSHSSTKITTLALMSYCIMYTCVFFFLKKMPLCSRYPKNNLLCHCKLNIKIYDLNAKMQNPLSGKFLKHKIKQEGGHSPFYTPVNLEGQELCNLRVK